MNTALDVWLFAGFELASFVGALVFFFRARRRARGARQRYVRAVRIVVAYTVLVFFYWTVGFKLQSSYTLAGAIFYGGTMAGFHVMLLAAVLIFAGILLLARDD